MAAFSTAKSRSPSIAVIWLQRLQPPSQLAGLHHADCTKVALMAKKYAAKCTSEGMLSGQQSASRKMSLRQMSLNRNALPLPRQEEFCNNAAACKRTETFVNRKEAKR
jgi:hypothetical protein